jgi:tetratricopeptide (TPR) repeat protein
MKQFFEKQIEALESKLEERPRDPVLHKELGNLFYRTDALFLALEEYRTALHIQPDYFEAQYNLGNVYFKLKKPWKAIIAWTEALILNPRLESARFNIGFAYFNLGEYDDALLEFRRASDMGPECTDTHFYQGMCHFELGQYRRARECYLNALDKDEDNEEILYNLGNALYEDGCYEEALDFYTRALKKDEDFQCRNNRADCLKHLDRLDEALAEIQAVLKEKKGFTPARCTLAEIYMRQGKPDEAISEFNRVIELTKQVRQGLDQNALHKYASDMVYALQNQAGPIGERQ